MNIGLNNGSAFAFLQFHEALHCLFIYLVIILVFFVIYDRCYIFYVFPIWHSSQLEPFPICLVKLLMLDIVYTAQLSFFDCVHILACAHTHMHWTCLCVCMLFVAMKLVLLFDFNFIHYYNHELAWRLCLLTVIFYAFHIWVKLCRPHLELFFLVLSWPALVQVKVCSIN